VKDRIRKSRQRMAPGAAEFVVEKQGPVQANATENVGQDVHS
jgi:hypothetical protein